MTQRLYYEDSHIRTFEATVLSCTQAESGWRVVLETLKERGLRAAKRIEARETAAITALFGEIFPNENKEA